MKRNKNNLSSYLLVYKLYLLGVLVALVITSSCVLVLSHSFGYIIDRTIVANDPQMLNLALVGFIGMAILLALATGIRYSLITLTGEYVTRDIRKDIYSKILSLSPSFYESSKSGEILSHLTTDITLLQSILSSTVSVMMRNALMLLGSLIMLAISSIKLTLMILFIVPFIIAPISYFSARLKRSAKQYQADVAGLAAISEETIYSIKTVQAYAREEWQQNMFDALLKKILNSAWSRVSTRALLIFIVISLIFCGIGFILWVGGRDVLSGALSLGQLTTFIFLSLICATTSMSLVEAFGEIQRASAAAQRIFIFLQEQSSVSDPLLPLKLETKGCDRLEFKDVVFSYPSDSKKEILSSISFVVETGQVLAIVGESGAGKSTIVQLILRFYDIQKGEILIDGINIKDLPLQELRQNFGYVGQDPVIFSTSAYNNILYGRPTATMEEVIEAAKVASAYEFIEGLHDGFKTFLGEKGVKLSGGQKQRIAIARAILKNPKILLLDEATSALDNKNENAIQNALEKLMYNRTTVVIAHRASTIINANEIILIKNGVIAARGGHNELITNNVDYKQHFANLTELKEVI